MKLFSIDAEIAFAEGVSGTISISFNEENIEKAMSTATDILTDTLADDAEYTIFRLEELAEDEA